MDDEPQRPRSDEDRAEGKVNWAILGMPWRTQPEITRERRAYLDDRRYNPMYQPDIEKGIYPFKGVKLGRADVEWLLATHQSGGKVGPVEWDDVAERKREGLDLRGADMSTCNLNGLPLARTIAGLTGQAIDDATPDQRLNAAIELHGAQLRYTRLEGAALTYAHLGGADMIEAHFEAADLYCACFASDVPADLRWAHFDGVTRLDRVTLRNARGVGPRVAGTYWNAAYR